MICLTFVILILAAAFGISRYQHTSSRRLADQYSESITQVHSSTDRDGDGVDDQQDILDGAISYVNTHPQYRSRYYDTGYPDDGYGVCTDVIANALKAAGYDLRELVAEDIADNPDNYDIREPDRNIDFRRVKNLQVFFGNHAVSLTTDVSAIRKWQGGDIVIFRNHIGIVSDRRNKNGVPYVIHHSNPWQIAYEQDVLERRQDIVGYYRIGA